MSQFSVRNSQQAASKERAYKERLKPLITIRRLFKEMWKEHPWVSAGLLTSLAARGAVPALELIVLGRLVDRTKGVIQGSIGRAIAPRS